MTMNMLGIREKIKPDDTADALAIAICTAHSSHAMTCGAVCSYRPKY